VFLADIAAALQRPAPALSRAAEDALLRDHWPGNVRELRHVHERVLVGGLVDRAMTPDALPAELLEQDEASLAPAAGARPTLEDVERRYIESTLQHARANQTKAASILGISRKALWEKRKRYGLQ
jgi:DNA-binding NtrC family response regulator